MICPHCKHVTNRRSSLEQSDVTRKAYYLCSNPKCSFSFVAFEQISHAVKQSAMPDQSVNLPLSKSKRTKQEQEEMFNEVHS